MDLPRPARARWIQELMRCFLRWSAGMAGGAAPRGDCSGVCKRGGVGLRALAVRGLGVRSPGAVKDRDRQSFARVDEIESLAMQGGSLFGPGDDMRPGVLVLQKGGYSGGLVVEFAQFDARRTVAGRPQKGEGPSFAMGAPEVETGDDWRRCAVLE